MDASTADETMPETRDAGAGPMAQLDPRIVQLRRTAGAIATALLGAASLIVLLVHTLASGATAAGAFARLAVWGVLVGLLAWHTWRWPAVAYRHTWYRADDLGLEIRRGVFWRTIVHVPRSRIQHTDVSQGPLERRYRLGTLVVYTAGTDYARVSLPGLEHATALRIREQLLPSGDSGAV